jgi:hypothetical protein
MNQRRFYRTMITSGYAIEDIDDIIRKCVEYASFGDNQSYQRALSCALQIERDVAISESA